MNAAPTVRLGMDNGRVLGKGHSSRPRQCNNREAAYSDSKLLTNLYLGIFMHDLCFTDLASVFEKFRLE